MNKLFITGAMVLFIASGTAWAANSPGFQNNMNGPESVREMRNDINDARRTNIEHRRESVYDRPHIKNDNVWRDMNDNDRREEMIREYRGVHGKSPNSEELKRWEKNRTSFWNNARVDDHRDELNRQYRTIYGKDPNRDELHRWHNERVRDMGSLLDAI